LDPEITKNALCFRYISDRLIILSDLQGAQCQFPGLWQRGFAECKHPLESPAPQTKHCSDRSADQFGGDLTPEGDSRNRNQVDIPLHAVANLSCVELKSVFGFAVRERRWRRIFYFRQHTSVAPPALNPLGSLPTSGLPLRNRAAQSTLTGRYLQVPSDVRSEASEVVVNVARTARQAREHVSTIEVP
jgi:hypothetical protein